MKIAITGLIHLHHLREDLSDIIFPLLLIEKEE